MSEKTILLVEDNPKDELLTLRALKEHKIANRIDVVRDGQQAADYLFDEKKALPTVVVLDLKLPKLNGHEVLQRIRSDDRTRLLPVVILTSSDEEKDITMAYESGVNSFVTKPVNMDEFSVAVRNLGLFWMLINKTAP